MESVDLLLSRFEADPNRKVLDAGCGLGGTAAYVQRSGWGQVFAFDNSASYVQYARATYPSVNFSECDIRTCSRCFPRIFQILYSLSVFYSLSDGAKDAAFRELAGLAISGASLVLLDYASDSNWDRRARSVHLLNWFPLNERTIGESARMAGWELAESLDLTAQYIQWYDRLLTNIRNKGEEIISLGGQNWYDYILSFYGDVVDCLHRGDLRGLAVYLVRS